MWTWLRFKSFLPEPVPQDWSFPPLNTQISAEPSSMPTWNSIFTLFLYTCKYTKQCCSSKIDNDRYTQANTSLICRCEKINWGGGGQQNSLLLSTQMPIHKIKIHPHLVIITFWPSVLSQMSLPPVTKNSSRVQFRWKFFWVETETTFKFNTYRTIIFLTYKITGHWWAAQMEKNLFKCP